MSGPGRRNAHAREAPRPDASAPAGTLLLLALAACAVLRAIAVLAPGTALWGLDTARDLPAPMTVAALVVAASGFVPFVRAPLLAGLERLGAALQRPAPALALAGLLAAVAFTARDDVRFVGDASLRFAAVPVRGDDARTLLQAAPLDRALNVALPRAIDDASPLDPARALQGVGALAAFAFALAAAAFAGALPVTGAARGAAWLAVVASGVPVHFAGYDKFGPLLVGLVLVAAGGARMLGDRASRSGAALLVAGTVTCVLAHRTGLLVVPAAALVAALGARRSPVARVALGLVLAALVAALPWSLGVAARYDAARHVAGAGLRASRLADAAQLLFLLAPLWPAGVVAATRVRAPRRVLAFAAAFAAPWLVLLVTVTGSQGAMRDWDMHTPAGLVVALGTAAALAAFWASGAGARRSAAAAATLTVAIAATAWALHASEPAQLARVARALGAADAWTDEAFARAQDFLGQRAFSARRWDEAVARWTAAAGRSPNPRYFYQVGLSHVRAGRFAQGRPWIEDARRRDPANADPWVGFALLAAADGDSAGAAAALDSALARNPRKWDALRMKRMLAEEGLR